ncbi:hypothetical protein OROMI_000801 [Orobanche minor]
MEVSNSGSRRKSVRLEKGKNILHAVDLSSNSSGQKRFGGYLSPLQKDIRKKTRMEGEPVRVIRRCLDPDFESPIDRGKDKSFGEMKRHKNPDGEGQVFVRPKFLKKWNFYYDESNRNFHGKATYWNNFDVPQIILNKLSDVQRDLFMKTPFGQFLDLKPRSSFLGSFRSRKMEDDRALQQAHDRATCRARSAVVVRMDRDPYAEPCRGALRT